MESPWINREFAEKSLKRIDDKFNSMTHQQVEYLLAHMNLHKNDKLLDLGCGAGRHAIEFAKHNIHVTGIDISATMLEKARERTENNNLVVNYIESDLAKLNSLGLNKNYYDGAICLCESGIGVIGGVDEDHNFFACVYDLLQQDAFFAISCFNSLRRYIRSRDQNPKFNYIEGTMSWSANINGIELAETQRLYAPSEIKMLLSSCGFRNVTVSSCADGYFSDEKLGIEDIEMLVIAKK